MANPALGPRAPAVHAQMLLCCEVSDAQMCSQAAWRTSEIAIGIHIRTGTSHTSAVQMATRSDVHKFHKCVEYLIRHRVGTFDDVALSKVR